MKLLFIPGSGVGKEAWLYQTEYFTDSEAIALKSDKAGLGYLACCGWCKICINVILYNQRDIKDAGIGKTIKGSSG